MPRFQYYVHLMPFKIHNIESVLNRLGEDGWELIWIDTKPKGAQLAYFKRRLEA